MSRPRRRWLVGRSLAVAAAAVLAGCATAPTAVFTVIGSPREEALSYFPSTAPAIALVATEPGDPGIRRLAEAGWLEPLEAAGERNGILYVQVAALLGEDLVVGLPRVGDPPLAALVTRDEDRLRALAGARVAGGRATRAGRYRGADLYASAGSAFAVRGPVLLVSRTTGDLRRALDVRSGGDSFDTTSFGWELQWGDEEDALARVYVDPWPVIARGPERVRHVPLVDALQHFAAAVRVHRDRVSADVRLDVASSGLVDLDLPAPVGSPAPRAAALPGVPTVTVPDLAHAAVAAERAANKAAPLTMLRLYAWRTAIRRETRVDVDRDVLSHLHGPATIALTSDGPMLRAEPSRPELLRRSLDRLAAGLRHAVPGVRLTARAGVYEIRRKRTLVARVGLVDGVLVAGRVSAARLRALAHAAAGRPSGAKGGFTFTVPATELQRRGLPARSVSGWLDLTPEDVRGVVTAPL